MESNRGQARVLTIDEQIWPMLVGRDLIALLYAATVLLFAFSGPEFRGRAWVVLFPLADLALNQVWTVVWWKRKGDPVRGRAPQIMRHRPWSPLQWPYTTMKWFGRLLHAAFGSRAGSMGRADDPVCPDKADRPPGRFRRLRRLLNSLFLLEHSCPSFQPECSKGGGTCHYSVVKGERLDTDTFCPWPVDDEWERTITVNRQREMATHFAWDFLLMSGTLLFLPDPRNLLFGTVFVLIISIAGGNLFISRRHWWKTPVSFVPLYACVLFVGAWWGGQMLNDPADFRVGPALGVALLSLLTFVFCDYLASLSSIRHMRWLEFFKAQGAREQKAKDESERARELAVAAYKIGHPMKHRVGPVRMSLKWFKDRASEGRIPEKDAWAEALWGLRALKRVEALGHILDVLSRALGSRTADSDEKERVFLVKEEWRDANNYDLTSRINELASEANKLQEDDDRKMVVQGPSGADGREPVIRPWIQSDQEAYRPADLFYNEILTELLANALRKGHEQAGRLVHVEWSFKKITDPASGVSQTALVLSNPCPYGEARSRTAVSSDAWEPWTSPDRSAVGGVLFLAQLLEYTGMGRLFVRISHDSGELGTFSVGLWLSGLDTGRH